MQQLLVYADSLTWGIVPMSRHRFSFDKRWPGILEINMNKAGKSIRVIEDCLNGRRTMYEDPIKLGRNGLLGLAQRIEVNSPLALVIIMLGTNDFQSNHDHTATDAAKGMAALIQAIRTAPIEPGMQIPQILVVAPPPICEPLGDISTKFQGGDKKCMGLAEAYRTLCASEHCHFFDAASVTTSSKVDGVHFDEDQHLIFGNAITRFIQKEFTGIL
jgi:lysophospholipase L1-like esterase